MWQYTECSCAAQYALMWQLPAGNCAELRVALRKLPCLLAQLKSTELHAWSFPNHNGTVSLAALDGHCRKLPRLPAVGLCGSQGGTRSLFDLYGTWLPHGHTPSGRTCRNLRTVHMVNVRVLPHSLSSISTNSTAYSTTYDTGAGDVNGGGSGVGGGDSGSDAISAKKTASQARMTVPAPRMVRQWQQMVYTNRSANWTKHALPDRGDGDSTREERDSHQMSAVRFVIFSRQRSASTTFVGL